ELEHARLEARLERRNLLLGGRNRVAEVPRRRDRALALGGVFDRADRARRGAALGLQRLEPVNPGAALGVEREERVDLRWVDADGRERRLDCVRLLANAPD